MNALREWSVYVRGRHFIFRADHEPLRYLQSKAHLTGRKFRRMDTLQEFSYEVQHIPGKQHVVPDALSRRPDHFSVQAQCMAMYAAKKSIPERIREGYNQDDWCSQLNAALSDGKVSESPKVKQQLINYAFDNGFLYRQESRNTREYIPKHTSSRMEILRHHHGTRYLGVDKVYNSCAKDVFWPKMYEDTATFIALFHECQVNKVRNQAPAELLKSLEVPERSWDVATTDFQTELSTSDGGFDAILVIRDKLSKRAIFGSVKKKYTAEQATQVFQDRLFLNLWGSCVHCV